MNLTNGVLGCLTALVVAGAPLRAQDSTDIARLDPATRAAVTRVLDSTRALGLPTQPLEWKISEGVMKRASGSLILAAVERIANGLRHARECLGSSSTTAELVAGSNALGAGVPCEQMRRIRETQPKRPVTTRLVVVADLVGRGVPIPDAAKLVVHLSTAGVSDNDFTILRREIMQDLSAGIPFATSLSTREREIASRLPRSSTARDTLRPPNPSPE